MIYYYLFIKKVEGWWVDGCFKVNEKLKKKNNYQVPVVGSLEVYK